MWKIFQCPHPQISYHSFKTLIGHLDYLVLEQCLSGIKLVNTSLFISMCILRDLPQQKNTRPLCWGSSPNFICSHIPMETFLCYQTGKKQVNKRTVVCIRGGFHTHVFSWGSGTAWGSCPGVPLPQKNTLIQEPPLQDKLIQRCSLAQKF